MRISVQFAAKKIIPLAMEFPSNRVGIKKAGTMAMNQIHHRRRSVSTKADTITALGGQKTAMLSGGTLSAIPNSAPR